jgi:hypothetical protein
MKKPDIIVALDIVIGCFENLGIAYYIAGSVASSAYGIARATMDVDLEYLKYWASRLNLSDLLNRSFDDAGMIESA